MWTVVANPVVLARPSLAMSSGLRPIEQIDLYLYLYLI